MLTVGELMLRRLQKVLPQHIHQVYFSGSPKIHEYLRRSCNINASGDALLRFWKNMLTRSRAEGYGGLHCALDRSASSARDTPHRSVCL